MKYESVRRQSPVISVNEAVSRGLAPDGGLYMPKYIPRLPDGFIERLPNLSFPEIAHEIAQPFFSPDIPEKELKEICTDAFNFEIPLKEVDGVYALELYHGPTGAFKDFGARFMARTLGHFAQKAGEEVTILTATSGDTGSAVAHGFFNVPGIHVKILFPKGKVSPLQEKQLTGMGGNITAYEVAGVFDDCQRMVKSALNDPDLNEHLTLTTANSINIARLVPQIAYYAELASYFDHGGKLVVSVPSGNFGNLTAGLMAKKMGVPIEKFVAATNVNDVVPDYLDTGEYRPRESVPTISNAMDVGNPSNFDRLLAMYGSAEAMARDVEGISFTDKHTQDAIADVYRKTGYIMDPHGAIAYLGATCFQETHRGFNVAFLETAHPAKFAEVVEPVIGKPVPMPDRLAEFLTREKQATEIPADFEAFKSELLK